MFTGYL